MTKFKEEYLKNQIEELINKYTFVSVSENEEEIITIKIEDENYSDEVTIKFYMEVVYGIKFSNGTTCGIGGEYQQDIKRIISKFENELLFIDNEDWKEMEEENN